MTAATLPRRAGFTLIELAVAITLIIVLAALTAGVLQSGAVESQRVVQSADRVSGWLLIAKNRAARDRASRGVRFFRNQDPLLTADTGDNPQFFVKEAQYIEGPDGRPHVPNPNGDPNGPRLVIQRRVADTISTPPPPDEVGGLRLFVVAPTTYFDPLNPNGVFGANVRDGWLLVSPDLPQSIRLAAFNPPDPSAVIPLVSDPNAGPGQTGGPPLPPGFSAFEIWCEPTARAALREEIGAAYTKTGAPGPDANLPESQASTFSTLNFAFQPPSNVLFGEPLLQLGNDVVIDARTSPMTLWNVPETPGNGFFDIIFAPSGQVLGNPNGILALWLRNPNRQVGPAGPYDFDNAGQQVLVVVYTRTGAISTQPVNFDAADPFRFAKDGINAGF